MTVYFSDTFTFPLPEGHRFPVEKYRMLREHLLRECVLAPAELIESAPAERAVLIEAHDESYVDAFLNGTIAEKAVRRIGLPWSPEFAMRSRATVGGTVAAARRALADGIAGNIAGGTHHAFRGEGEGFCVFNDIAVAARVLLDEGAVSRVAVVDLDVHQGNGTAEILGADPRVFLLDFHGRNNFPFRKFLATLDIPLDDGVGDAEYLALLEQALPRVTAFAPDIIFYQAGVDVLEQDTLGKLRMTYEGVAARDRMVLEAARDYAIPIVLTLGGGYARPIDASVRAYAGTYRVVKEVFEMRQAT